MSVASTPPKPPQRDLIERLQAAPLFRGFTDTGLQIIASIAHLKTLPSGSPLFVENMIGDTLFVVSEGRVRLAARDGAGQEVTLTRVTGPDSLGEAALLRPGPRQCTAVAETEVRVIEIARRDVAHLQRSKPQACLKLMMGVVDLIGERLRAAEPDLKRYLLGGPP